MNILDLLKVDTRVIGSEAPGSGPGSFDSRGNMPRLPVPDPGKPNMLGYGGGGDAATGVAMVPRQGAEHGSTSMLAAQARMPGISFGGQPAPLVPRYNHFYDTHRTRDGWRFISDDVITVTLTPSTSATVATAINPTVNAGLFKTRLSQYPGGVHLLLCVRAFGFVPQVTTMTGALEFRFAGANGGDIVPLGVYQATGVAGNQDIPHILNTPLTDAGLSQYGTLLTIPQGLGGTPGLVTVQLGVSFVYVTPDPAFRGYSQESGSWRDQKEANSVQ